MTAEAKSTAGAGGGPGPTPVDGGSPPAPALGGTLFVLMIGVFVTVLDFFIVNVAIPSIQTDLHAGASAIQFVVAGYAIAYAGGLVIGGRLGDIFGRRRLYAVGIVLFTLASLACGLAPTAGALVAARVVQGLAAAVLAPQVLSTVGATMTGEAKARGFTLYGVTMGLASVFGQLIGGLLIQGDVFGLGWRACFLINIPIGALALALIPRFMPDSRSPGKPTLDIGGMLLFSAALIAVVLPLIEGREQGWPLWAWASLAGAVVLFAAFAAYERSIAARQGSPLLDPGMFRERAFTAGLLAQLVFYFGQASFFLVFALYVQEGRHYDALHAGLIFIALGGGYMVTSLTARFVAARIGRQVIALGAVLRIVGMAGLIAAVAHVGTTGSIWWLVPALVIDGAGQGLAVAPLASTVLSRITPHYAGAASGVLSTGAWAGNAFGVAVIGVIFYGRLAQTGPADPFGHAFSGSLVYIIAVAAALAVLVQLLPAKPAAAK
ncbi:MFS transporter [Dactylosporangium sp. NPDC049140]|uniref:MFS transporter n=1 Tax=Dactylosporangium sp. NPDC049140 TaxID=3155647 RepID=UPI003403F244